ncbi:MAG: response regulator transcription factor [Saprospiraceae bacterium]|nr:response regulator transcription factor [Saprospiraceae bacterium]
MKILLVDDHKIIRQVLGDYLKDNLDAVIFEAGNGQEALEMIKGDNFEIVITDVNMPKMDGVELMKNIHEYDPELKVIALSMMDDKVSIKKMLKAGAQAYVLKEGNTEDLVKAIKAVINGEKYYSSTVTEVIMDSLSSSAQTGTELTNREREILYLIFQERSNKEIAEQLFISLRTVETHKHNIMEKTGAKNLAGLVKFAIRNKLFDDLFY